MANFTSNKINKSDFDWDEINVGDYNLDHSENFFAAPSFKANALEEAYNFNQDMDNLNTCKHPNMNFDWNEMQADHNKSNPRVFCDNSSNKENFGTPNRRSEDLKSKKSIKGELTSNGDLKKIAVEPELEVQQNVTSDFVKALESLNWNSEESQIVQDNVCDEDLDGIDSKPLATELQVNLFSNSMRYAEVKCEQNDKVEDSSECCSESTCVKTEPLFESSDMDELSDTRSVKNESVEQSQKPRLKLNWTPMPSSRQDEVAPTAANVPRAYECKDMYQAKREMIMRQREEEERKAREFHSKPVPNFKLLHKRLADTIVIHRITMPVTPETLKHSYAQLERRRRREEESKLEQQNQDIAKHTRRAAMHETKAFQLRADQRVRERREYNHVMQSKMAEKKNQQDEQRKQRELEEAKELRKMTEFKARPNPFK